MEQSNKEPGPVHRWMARAVRWMACAVRYLREWRARHARIVYGQLMRGVAFGVGSGSVSLLVIWYETRH